MGKEGSKLSQDSGELGPRVAQNEPNLHLHPKEHVMEVVVVEVDLVVVVVVVLVVVVVVMVVMRTMHARTRTCQLVHAHTHTHTCRWLDPQGGPSSKVKG